MEIYVIQNWSGQYEDSSQFNLFATKNKVYAEKYTEKANLIYGKLNAFYHKKIQEINMDLPLIEDELELLNIYKKQDIYLEKLNKYYASFHIDIIELKCL